jgi:uncharacterized protein (TIGR03086 family)
MVTRDDLVTRLIQSGRDREAAVVGAKGDTMDALTQLDRLGPLLAGVVHRIRPEQLGLATPCAEFTVHEVLEHVVGGGTTFAAAYRGEAPRSVPTGDMLAAFDPALADLAAAISSPGALERTLATPFGALDGETFARYVVLDGLVHGWDLATATGQRYEPPDDLVAAATETAYQLVDRARDGTTFGPAVEPAADATPMERLAAYTGRRVMSEGVGG